MLYCQFGEYKANFLMNMWFQKLSILPPRRELEIPKLWGEGDQRPRKFEREGG